MSVFYILHPKVIQFSKALYLEVLAEPPGLVNWLKWQNWGQETGKISNENNFWETVHCK